MKSKEIQRPRASIFARSLQIIHHIIGVQGPITQKDLARDLKMPPATVHRILSDLEAQGWIVQDRERCRIEIGASLVGMSAVITWRYGIDTAIRPLLKSLVRETGETVCLNLYDEASAQLVAYVVEESDRPLSYRVTPGDVSFLHTGASGRAVMAFLSDEDYGLVVRTHGLPAVTKNTITNPARLRRELAAVRKAGFAFSKGERLEQAVGVAAPVFGPDDKVRGSLLVTVPAFRFAAKDKAKFAKSAIACASKLKQLISPARGVR